MDFHCKEFQLHDLTKLLCSSMFLMGPLITVTSEHTELSHRLQELKMACRLPWASFGFTEYLFNYHLFSYFWVMEAPDSTHPPWHSFQRRLIFHKKGHAKDRRRQVKPNQTKQEKVKTIQVSTTINLPKKEEHKVREVTLEVKNLWRIYKLSYWHREET